MKYLLFLLLPLQLYSQDITGLWAGSLFNDTTQANLRYEVAIQETKGNYTAYSLTTFILDNVEYTGMKSLKVSRGNGKVYLEDINLVYNNYPVAPPKGIKQLTALTLAQDGKTPVLTGKFITTRTKEYGKHVTGTVRLEKQEDITPSKLIPVLYNEGLAKNFSFLQPRTDTIAAAPVKAVPPPPIVKDPKKPPVKSAVTPPKTTNEPVPDLTKRKIETIETIFFTSDSLQLAFYDNGYVDGDSISLIVDGKVLLQHQLLSKEAIRKTIQTPVGVVDSLNIIMYAENLGSIAPNSGVLILYDGDKRHEITFSGDLQKNAGVLLKRKK